MCEWSGPRAPPVRRLSDDMRATPAVLYFPRDTRAGRMISLTPPEEEEKEEGESSGDEGEEGGPGLP